jgi:predicted DNA-binding transcriptional regulator YafY
VIDGLQIDVDYRDRQGARSVRRVHPLGLASKGASWYLVADTDAGQRTFRVDRMVEVTVTDAPAVRPDGFVLADAWRLVIDRVEDIRLPVRARVMVPPGTMPWMRYVFGPRLSVGGAGADGRVEAEVRGSHADAMARDLAGFGALVEVVDPPDLRDALASLGRDLCGLYAADGS